MSNRPHGKVRAVFFSRSVGAGRRVPAVFLAEAFDAACGVDELLLAGKERVAVGADIGMDLVARGPSGEGVATGTLDGRGRVDGVDVFRHRVLGRSRLAK